jgi:hypothetical protein
VLAGAVPVAAGEPALAPRAAPAAGLAEEVAGLPASAACEGTVPSVDAVDVVALFVAVLGLVPLGDAPAPLAEVLVVLGVVGAPEAEAWAPDAEPPGAGAPDSAALAAAETVTA